MPAMFLNPFWVSVQLEGLHCISFAILNLLIQCLYLANLGALEIAIVIRGALEVLSLYLFFYFFSFFPVTGCLQVRRTRKRNAKLNIFYFL